VRRERGASAPRLRSASSGGASITLTGRGGIVVMFGTGLVGALFSHWLDMQVLAGLSFAAGCALAALTTRPADLLTVAVSPPAVFFAVTVIAEFLTTVGEGSLMRGMAVGLLTSLAATAPWLFAGTILVLVIAFPRGLLTTFNELRDKLVGSRLFEEEENENPVRWDESPATDTGAGRVARTPARHEKKPPLPHGDID